MQLIELELRDPRQLMAPLRLPVEISGTSLVIASIPKSWNVMDDLVFTMELPPSFTLSVGFFDRGESVDVVVAILPDS